MTISKMFAAAAMTAVMMTPVVLLGCNDRITWAEVCDEGGPACGNTAEEISACKAVEANSRAMGCGGFFDDFEECVADNYKTPTTEEECGSICLNEAGFLLQCQKAACAVDSSQPGCS